MEKLKSNLVDCIDIVLRNHGFLTAAHFATLQNSAFAGKLIILRDALTRPAGYIAWAGVNKETVRRIIRFKKFPSRPCEWSEGDICLILDVAINKSFPSYAAQEVRNFIRSQRSIIYARDISKPKLFVRRGGLMRNATNHKKSNTK